MTTFVDSSAWYAAADADDGSHASITHVLPEATPLVTSDHVIVETWYLLNRRLGRRAAERFLLRCTTEGLQVEDVGRADLERAVEIGRRFADQDFSVVDRTSFSMMERLGIESVVTLDDDFAVYRWGERRQRSFTVLR